MKSPLLIDVKFDTTRKYDGFEKGVKGRQIINLNAGEEPEDYSAIEYALVWQPEPSLLDKLTGLKVLFSAGAGVDHIFSAGKLPDVPIVRFADPTLTTRMSEWVCLQCLSHLRQTYKYIALQRNRTWQELPQPEASEINVGIMGMGNLGKDSAKKLKTLGFAVNGWSRTKKDVEGINCFGENELDDFLAQTDFLVGLLPLTKQTTNFFSRDIFEKLKRNEEIASPVFINGGRGGSQVEADIVSCLQDGTLGGVSLDVFQQEPLEADSALWGYENAILTPHAAAISDIAALGSYIEGQIERFEAGKELEHVVDLKAGY